MRRTYQLFENKYTENDNKDCANYIQVCQMHISELKQCWAEIHEKQPIR